MDMAIPFLVLDELESIMEQMNNKQTKKAFDNKNTFVKCLQRSNQILCMDG